MKWAVVGLCLLGCVAAISAAFLVNALRAAPADAGTDAGAATDSPDVQVIYAARSVPAMTVMDASVIEVRTMDKTTAPHQFMSDPDQVVGKVLSVPLSQGQPITQACFTKDDGSRQLASVIPPGKRAVGISVTDYGGLEGLLYPGSMVDVMGSFKPQEGDSQAVTTTLLENVQVLAIEEQTVVSPGKSVNQAMDDSYHNQSRRVTLLVDSRQAKILQLAMGQGTLSLALRNPMDQTNSDGQDVSLSGLFGGPTPAAAAPVAPSDPFSAPQAPPAAQSPGSWDVTVINGQAVETKSFPVPSGSRSDSTDQTDALMH